MIDLNALLNGTLALNSVWLAIAALTGTVVIALATGSVRGSRLRRHVAGLDNRLEESASRLVVLELLLADTTGDASMLRQRVDQLTSRHDNIATTNTRNGFRQAIALSRHGATIRQLIDTCGLSQGEAHLIQTLYGRSGEESAVHPAGDGLH